MTTDNEEQNQAAVTNFQQQQTITPILSTLAIGPDRDGPSPNGLATPGHGSRPWLGPQVPCGWAGAPLQGYGLVILLGIWRGLSVPSPQSKQII